MKFIDHIRKKIELKLLVSILIVSTLVVAVFGIALSKYFERWRQSLLMERVKSFSQQSLIQTQNLLKDDELHFTTFFQSVESDTNSKNNSAHIKLFSQLFPLEEYKLTISKTADNVPGQNNDLPYTPRVKNRELQISYRKYNSNDTLFFTIKTPILKFIKRVETELFYHSSREKIKRSLIYHNAETLICSNPAVTKILSTLITEKQDLTDLLKTTPNGFIKTVSLPGYNGFYIVLHGTDEQLRSDTRHWAVIYLFISLGVVILMTIFIDIGIRNIVLTRLALLRKILNQEWVDIGAFTSLRGEDEIGELVKSFQKMSRQIQRRVEMEQLVADVSKDLVSHSHDDSQSAITHVLKKLGIFSQSDRTYLLLLDKSKRSMKLENHWVRNGLEERVSCELGFECSTLPWLMAQLYENQPVIVNSISSLPAEAEGEIDFWKRAGVDNKPVTSLVIRPIILNGSLVGCIGCDTLVSSLSWSSFDTQILGMIAEIIGSSIERERTNRLMEEKNVQLIQAQKMESIGHLAGGIAHDFNNILAGIISSTSLFYEENHERESLPFSEVSPFLETVQGAGHRAASVVQQLLGLSRKQEYNFTTVDINQILRQVNDIAVNSFDKSVTVKMNLCEGESLTKADAIQLEQVLLNFLVNGMHAMTVMRPPSDSWGGMLTIETKCVSVDNIFKKDHPVAFEDYYWHIAITDTGVGIPKDHYDRIFDPFFTTKSKGVGTGLGLSMIYRIIQEHYGFVDFNSEVGKGTTFNIYLPYIDAKATEENKGEVITQSHKESATILVVDDEPLLRKIAKRILSSQGHTVLLAENGAEAVDIFEARSSEIDAVVLDLVMPVLSGRETYIELAKIKPNISVLISSGFRKDERVDELIEMGVSGFLQKPYTVDQMKSMMADILSKAQ